MELLFKLLLTFRYSQDKLSDWNTPAFKSQGIDQSLNDNFSKKASLNIETDDSLKYYELDISEEFIVDYLSDKMEQMKVPKIIMIKKNPHSSRSTLETNHSKNNSVDTKRSLGSNTKKGIVNDESPGSKQNFSRMECDELYKAKRAQKPNESPVTSPSKKSPFDYSFADGSSLSDEMKGDAPNSFGDKLGLNNYGSPINNQLTPKTQADSVSRKNSCFSCSDEYFDRSLLVPSKPKLDRNKLKTQSKQLNLNFVNEDLEMKMYLDKAKSVNAKPFPSMKKHNKSVHSVLECIDEEDSNESIHSKDNSAYTVDPRYLTKEAYFSTLKKNKSSKAGRSSYSILAKKVTNEDLIKITKGRSTMSQPKQQYLSINRSQSRKLT